MAADFRDEFTLAFSGRNAHETAEILSDNLPIHLNDVDVENNPEFTKLLLGISRNVTQSGVGKETQKELQEAQGNLREEKIKYFQLQSLYHELKDRLLEYDLSQGDQSKTSSSVQFYEIVKEIVTIMESLEHLQFSPSSSNDQISLFGLSKEHLYKSKSHWRSLQQHIQSVQQNLIPELEQRLKQKCEALASFHEPEKRNSGSEELSVVKSFQVPVKVENEQRKLSEDKLTLKRARDERDKQFEKYYKVLVESLKIVEKLIINHRLQSQENYDKPTADWLAARCDAMCLKIKVLQNKLARDTYTTETVPALRKISDHLVQAERELTSELHSSQHVLKAYEAVGSEFDSLVQEYTRLMAEIDNKKWALSELQQSGQDQDTSTEGL